MNTKFSITSSWLSITLMFYAAIFSTCKKEPRELDLNQLKGKVAFVDHLGPSFAGELALPGLLIRELPSPHSAYRWSHDGKLLAMQDEWSNIFVLDAISFDTIRKINPPGTPQGFAWSPDDSEIAIGLFDSAHIYVYSASGQQTTPRKISIGQNDLLTYSLDWSNDGKYFAFCSRDTVPNYYLAIIDADGTNYKRLDTQTLPFYNARISPDGQKIAYSDLLDQIKIQDAHALAGTEPEIFISRAGRPIWSKDGKYLMYNHIVSVSWTSSKADIKVREISGDTKETLVRENATVIDWYSE